MVINFMKYPNNIIQPICFGNYQLERRVSTFKKLGVKARLDLIWNYHIDYIYGKAAKWLYSLTVLKRAGVAGSNIVNIISALWDHLYLHMPSRHGKIFLRPYLLFLQIKWRRILDILWAFLVKQLFHSRLLDMRLLYPTRRYAPGWLQPSHRIRALVE